MRKTAKAKPLLSSNIVRLRTIKGWTAEQLAERADVKYPTLRDIEAGVSRGTPKTLGPIANALGCAIDDLYQIDKPERFTAQDTRSTDTVISPGEAQIIEILEKRLPQKLEEAFIPNAVLKSWRGADPVVQAACVYLLTGRVDDLKKFGPLWRELVEDFRKLGLRPPSKASS